MKDKKRKQMLQELEGGSPVMTWNKAIRSDLVRLWSDGEHCPEKGWVEK